MNTLESPVHDGAKRASIEHQVADTVYTNRVDGLYGRYVDAPGAQRLIHQRLNPLSALLRSREIAGLLGLPWGKLAAGIVLSGYKKSVQMARMAIGFEAFKNGCTQGDLERGVLPLGQCTGLIDDTPTVAAVIDRIVREAEAATNRLEQTIRHPVAVV
jgi:enoyl-[acyl-carrier protein] reductase II